MIEELLPPPAAAVDAFRDHEGALTDLFPQEAAVVARAVAKRRLEYATVRGCARQALARLDEPAVPLLSSPRGAPRWPVGVVGSMTHCEGYRAAAVGRSSAFHSLGIDAEPNAGLRKGLLERISLPGERGRLRELADLDPGVHWDRLLFSTKEAVFKTWYPLTLRELNFDAADISIDPESGTFRARLLTAGAEIGGERLDVFDGRWLCANGFVVTAIALRRPTEPPCGADPDVTTTQDRIPP